MNKKLLITGGAGFIGSNLADFFADKNYHITIYDNLKRLGTKENLNWLLSKYPKIKVIKADIRSQKEMEKAVRGQDIIFHLAAQVAVTSSVTDPTNDFQVNAWGTFNLLEAVRKKAAKPPIVIFASTNKVYGEMKQLEIMEEEARYSYKNLPAGVSEDMNLDFHSPYGCSKGAADQYIHDYHRIYHIPTVVFRQSCIYGPRQFGVEDQGWIAWFIIALTLGKPLTIYGDGKQVRDVLYISDLVNLFEIATKKIDIASGKIYNVGGGSVNTLSVWREFSGILEKLYGKKIRVSFKDWRPGDQKIYVSNIKKVEKELGWKPKISVQQGIRKLYQWVTANKDLFEKLFG